MSDSAAEIGFRPYRPSDRDAVFALWATVNRELAPPHLRAEFETYIAVGLTGELERLEEIFAPARRNAFWVVERAGALIGTVGIEAREGDATELRRMYLERGLRGQGIAQRMLRHAEAHARDLGFRRMILSTAEVQHAALAFYRKSGYRQVRTEIADAMSVKTVGGGLTRYHFEKVL